MKIVPRSAKSAYFLSAGFANLADGVSALTWGWLAVQMTDSLAQASLIVFIWRLPWLLLSLPIGVLVDRLHRIKTIALSDALSAALFVLLVVILANSNTTAGAVEGSLFTVLCGFAFVVGTLEVIRDTAAQAAIPTIFEDDALEKSNSYLWLIELLNYLAFGPLLAALLFEFADYGPFALNVFLLLTSSYLAFRYVVTKSAARPISEKFWPSFKAGLKFFWSERLLPTLSMITALWNIVFYGGLTSIVYLAQARLNLSPSEYGFVISIASVGAVIAALTGPRLSGRFQRNALSGVTFAVAAMCLIAIGFVGDTVLLTLLLAVVLFAGPIWNVVSVTYRQRHTPNEMLGRVIGVHRFAALGASAVGPLLVGLVGAAATKIGQSQLEIAFSLGFLALVCAFAALKALNLRNL